MKKLLITLVSSVALCNVSLSAETIASEFSLFKRITSPSMNWGENSMMLVPKANPIGKGNINISATSVDSGKI